jgi:putative flippase GtrA
MPAMFNNPRIRTHASQLWRFIICGGMGFTLDLSSAALFVEVGDVDPRIAVIFSSLVGGTFVFFANKFFTFKNREKKTGQQLFKFLIVYGVSFLSNIAIANALIWLDVHYLLAKVVAVGIGAVWNYALSHGFVFKKKEDVDVVVA